MNQKESKVTICRVPECLKFGNSYIIYKLISQGFLDRKEYLLNLKRMKIIPTMNFKNNDEMESFERYWNSFLNDKYLNDNALNETKDELSDKYFSSFSLKCWDWEKHCYIPRGESKE